MQRREKKKLCLSCRQHKRLQCHHFWLKAPVWWKEHKKKIRHKGRGGGACAHTHIHLYSSKRQESAKVRGEEEIWRLWLLFVVSVRMHTITLSFFFGVIQFLKRILLTPNWIREECPLKSKDNSERKKKITRPSSWNARLGPPTYPSMTREMSLSDKSFNEWVVPFNRRTHTYTPHRFPSYSEALGHWFPTRIKRRDGMRERKQTDSARQRMAPLPHACRDLNYSPLSTNGSVLQHKPKQSTWTHNEC